MENVALLFTVLCMLWLGDLVPWSSSFSLEGSAIASEVILRSNFKIMVM